MKHGRAKIARRAVVVAAAVMAAADAVVVVVIAVAVAATATGVKPGSPATKFYQPSPFRAMVSSFHELAGVQDPVGIQRVLDLLMDAPNIFRYGERPPWQFCESDAMFAGNDPLPGDHLAE